MKIAPLIHSRTLYRDFNSNFAVRPADLNVDWAMSKILPSTRDIDILDGVRRVVATDGKICIAGISCNFKMFAEKFLSPEERDEAKKYFYDERGREIKVFLGYVFKDSGVPDVSDSKLWQMFKKYFAPQWELKASETEIAPYEEDCKVKSVAKKNLDKFYPTNDRNDIELFEQCIAARKDFCSNVDAVKIFEDGKYEIITATQSVINRIQEAQKKTQSPSPNNHAQATERFQTQHSQSQRIHTSREKGNPTLLILVAVVALIVIAVAIFSTREPAEEPPTPKDSQTSMNCAPILIKNIVT